MYQKYQEIQSNVCTNMSERDQRKIIFRGHQRLNSAREVSSRFKINFRKVSQIPTERMDTTGILNKVQSRRTQISANTHRDSKKNVRPPTAKTNETPRPVLMKPPKSARGPMLRNTFRLEMSDQIKAQNNLASHVSDHLTDIAYNGLNEK